MMNNKRLGPPAFGKGGGNQLSSFFSNANDPDDIGGIDNDSQALPAFLKPPAVPSRSADAAVMRCDNHPPTVYDLAPHKEDMSKDAQLVFASHQKGVGGLQGKANTEVLSLASNKSASQSVVKHAPRVSPTTIPDDVPTKTPANTEDSDMQSGTQSPSRSHEDVNEIFEALSENVHNALMEVHAICCDGVQDALEQKSILDQMSAAVLQNSTILKKRKRRTVEAVDNIRRRLSESLEDGTDADTE